jgi:NADPH:quinone reductase-like Zn-dependent oxidoreductase
MADNAVSMSGTSRAWFVDRYGGPERLVLRERPDPIPGPGEAVVKTASIGLNFADLFVRAGAYPQTPKTPFVPGMEIAGSIAALGSGVKNLSVGQPVAAVPIFGGHAERVMLPADRVFALPDGVDLAEAAAMPVVFLTAWYAIEQTRLRRGDRVVVTAAAGGVGTALLQLCALRGTKTLALAGSASKLALCRELRATAAGTYENALHLLDSEFEGRADVVIDAIGGRLFRKLWRRLDKDGRYALYGFAAASGARGVAKLRAAAELLAMGTVIPYGLVQSCKTLLGFNLSLLASRTDELRGAAAELFGLWKAGSIRPVLGPRFDFAHLPDAHRALASRGTTGKVVITV